MRKFIDGPSSYLTLPDELKSAIEAITYIAEALQAEKDYEAVSVLKPKTALQLLLRPFWQFICLPACLLKEDWQYVAMVVDRMFLWIFVVFTTVGTLAIFTDASTNHTPTDPFKP
ncbi:Acetylcholine receptor subunit beta [Merluccius polli]|uniref:Acetylcholine receptor subunit beta n=1 Tax=Merluccius polli TaxID=89951 RepID=A0AA47M104_MERPO|nr:Acetylcholine receptor subunit beta [Merluccius polli]